MSSQSMQERILSHLKETYSPLGLVLHGSRAKGNAKEHSDWDIFVITKDSHQQITTCVFEGEHIDAAPVPYPIDTESLWPNFIPQFAQGSIVYDPEGCIASAQEQIISLYRQGKTLNAQEVHDRERFWDRSLGRMEDTMSDPVLFRIKGITPFLVRMTRYFFEMKGEWDKPLQEALPLIKTTDPTYYQFIQQLSDGRTSPEDSLNIAQKAYTHIFGKPAGTP